MSASPRQWLHQMDTKASANHHFDFDADFQLLGCDMDSDLGMTCDLSPSNQFFSPTTESADATLAPTLYDFESTFPSFEHCGAQPVGVSGTSDAAVPSFQTLGDSFESSSTSPWSASDLTSPSCDNAYWSQSETSLDADERSFLQLTSAIRQLVHAKADACSSGASNKEKRRDAAISLHLQLLKDAPVEDAYFMSDASTPGYSFDPCSEFLSCSDSPMSGGNSLSTDSSGRTTQSPSTPSSSVSVAKVDDKRTTSRSAHAGVELVLDLNMNETTSGPKKQKPRTQAQRESYINARRNGACEKHRKQHKRCHCFDSVSACIGSIKKMRAQEKPSSIRQVIQERDNKKALQLIQATHEALEQEASAAAEFVDALLPRADIYTCLFPGCTFTSRTVASLQRHYSSHSFVLSPTISPTGDMQTPVWSPALPIPQYFERSSSESVFSDASAASVSASVPVHAQGDEPHRYIGVLPHAPTVTTRPSTTDVSDSIQKSDYQSSYARRVSNGKPGGQGEAEIYDSQQKIWRDKQQSPVSLGSPSEHIAEPDSSGICGYSGLASLAQAYAEIVRRAIIAVGFSWVYMAAVSLLQNLYSASATISSKQRHHIRSFRLEVVI